MIVAGFPSVTGGSGGGGGGGGGLTASASPSSAFGSNLENPITTNSVTVSASGGTAPYTYSWAIPIGAVDSPTSATTTFTNTVSAGTTATTAVCTVRDSASHSATVNVPVSWHKFASGGGGGGGL